MAPKLSILIPTVPERADFLRKLRISIDIQARTENVEVLYDDRPRPVPIGTKRNSLLERATGDYVAFVDDDDAVSTTYVRKVLMALKSKPDCVGINGFITFDGKNGKRFIHTVQCKEWHERGGVYYRCPNHLNPIRRDLALKAKFPGDSSFGEDKEFSMRVRDLLKAEAMIPEVIYFYHSRSVKKEFAKSP